MSARPFRKKGRPPIELIEQAIALLRRTPLSAYLLYYLGAVPFWLGLLYFIADTSRSAFAGERLSAASLVLALLFIHMKCWHAAFAARLRELLLGAHEPWTLRRVLRLIMAQAAWQPTGLIIRPLAYAATLPAIWASAFYHNLTVLGDGRAETKPLAARALEQAGRWSSQAHWVCVWLLVFGFFVWLNVAIFLGSMPSLLKTLFGIETMASRSNMGWLLNSTFPTVTIALTFLCVDPILKAVFVLRCFYGDSIQSGADLRVQLRAVS